MLFARRAAALSTAAAAVAAAALAGLPAPATAADATAGATVEAQAAAVARTATAGQDYRPGEVVVRFDAARKGPSTKVVQVTGSVPSAMRRLGRRAGVRSASPNWLARTSYVPNDPGDAGLVGGWTSVQWNFLEGTAGVDAPRAWDNLIAAGRAGGRGVVVAVLDTGVAYRDYRNFKQSPDLFPRLRRGYDFVDNDRYPLDHNGHGTHVASTIAETVNNGVALTGLAYGATILPVRVLDRLGWGDSAGIASGIRYAADRGAQIINLSFEFSAKVRRASQIPDILSALRYARHKGVLVVGASGNEARTTVAYPARSSRVLSVGATTEHGCQADYSNAGSSLDLSAPGGGPDADLTGDANCHPDQDPGRDIVQMTFDGSVRQFGLPGGYVGTSMAAPHVSATAALVIASGVLGPKPSPAAIERRLKITALDLGPPGPDARYGYGKVDAGRATAPLPPPAATPTPTP
jgi:serine protease